MRRNPVISTELWYVMVSSISVDNVLDTTPDKFMLFEIFLFQISLLKLTGCLISKDKKIKFTVLVREVEARYPASMLTTTSKSIALPCVYMVPHGYINGTLGSLPNLARNLNKENLFF